MSSWLNRSRGLEDSPLTLLGYQEAVRLGARLSKLDEEEPGSFRKPSTVFVSPLRRAVQTAIA